MASPRQIYQYLVAGISLQAVLWAVIGLARDLFQVSGSLHSRDIIAQLSIIIIGLPIFLVHWIWAQRLTLADDEERSSPVRQLFLYGQLAGLLGPMIDSTFAILGAIILSGSEASLRWHRASLTTGQEVLFYGIALAVLVPGWLYFRSQARNDEEATTLEGAGSIIRQLYTYAFAGVGLGMVYYASLDLISFLFHLPSIIANPSTGRIGIGLLLIAARLSIGVPVWVLFWNKAQARLSSDEIEERQSPVRGWYLYLLVLTSVLSAVTSLTLILEGFLRKLLGVSSVSQTSDDLILAISVVLCSGVVWYFHSRVLRRDAELEIEIPRRETLRRIYHYLMAGIGFGVVLVGIVSLLTMLLTAFEGGHFAPFLRSQLALGISLLIAGLPIWLFFWNGAQKRVAGESRSAQNERDSLPRKIYLYAFMFVSIIVLLLTAVSLVMSLLGAVLGESVPIGSELGRLFAYSILAAIVLTYQVYVLRTDRALGVPAKVEIAANHKVIVLYQGSQEFADYLVARFKDRRFPGEIEAVQVPSSLNKPNVIQVIKDKLQTAQIVLLSWEMLVDESIAMHLMNMLDEIKAHKILVPLWRDGWNWAGVERWSQERLANQAIFAARQVINEREVKVQKSIGCGAIIGIIILVLISLSILIGIIAQFAL